MQQILFVHQNFPGQYRYMARHFAAHPGWKAFAIGERANVTRQLAYIPNQGLTLMGYDAPPKSSEKTLGLVQEFESHLYRARSVASLALRQRQNGLNPDIICSHPGWGDSLYLKEVFPEAKFLSYFEYYFQPNGELTNFDLGDPVSITEQMSFRSKNATNLLALEMADVGVCPTHWQWSTFPKEFKEKIRVIHDGVDTEIACSQAGVTVKLEGLAGGPQTLSASDEIITYSVRNLEPHRGFHIFMKALPKLLRRRPNARILIIGGDEVSYGKKHASGKSWREALLAEIEGEIDLSRVAFTGKVPYPTLLNLFRITSLHVYLTSPFVLSWSMLEAMACGAPVLASATPPVTEVIEDGVNGHLFDFNDIEGLVERVDALLDDPVRRGQVARRGRETIVDRYDLKTQCLPAHLSLIEDTLSCK